MIKDVVISVLVPTYNQEKTIGQTLQSIVDQKINVPVEVLVGEDCSTDGTADIVREYAARYPELIIPYIREKNYGSIDNPNDLFSRARGKYFSILEGDDFWCDEYKLQKQYDFLESHPDYIAVFSTSKIIDQDGNHLEWMEQEKTRFFGGEYTIAEFEKYMLPGQVATSFYRTETRELYKKMVEEKDIHLFAPLYDRFWSLLCLGMGKIFTFNEQMAVYRYNMNPESGSWSSQNDFFNVKNCKFYLSVLNTTEEVADKLNMPLNFDERRLMEFSKISEYKGILSKSEINELRNIIYKNMNSKFKLLLFILKRKLKRG